MAESFDYLKIVGNLFELMSDDPLDYCEKTIEQILRLVRKNNCLPDERTKPPKISDPEAEMFSLAVLIQFYESRITGRSQKESMLHFDLILQVIEDLLNDTNEKFDLSGHSERNVLSIVSMLFRIACEEECEENVSSLARFYHRNLEEINNGYACENFNSTQVNLRLKILCCFYSLAPEINLKHVNVSDFFKLATPLDINSNIDKHKLIANLVIHGMDDVFKTTLLLVIPNYVKCFESGEVVAVIWKNISDLISNQSGIVLHSRVLLILCSFQKILRGNKNLTKLLLEDKNYWKLIQSGLSESDPTIKKQSMYLFKSTVDLLANSDENDAINGINYLKASVNVDVNFKNELVALYKELIVVLEFLDEQQVHLIKPVFKMVDDVVKKIILKPNKNSKFDFSWIVLIYERALKHESMQVVKWALDSLLKLPDEFYTDEITVEKIVCLLVSTLNCSSLYYNDGLLVSKKLEIFFKKFAKFKTSKLFFSSLISIVCSSSWSPEALYFVIHALAQIPKNSFWHEKEIADIKSFVITAFKTHNKMIRTAIQCDLLNSIISLTNKECVSLESVILLLTTFSNSGSLQCSSQIWEKIIVWIGCNYSPKEAENCLEKISLGESKTEFNKKSFALMLSLFFEAYDSCSQDKDSANDFIMHKLMKMLSSFKNCRNRPYCDTSLLDEHLTIVCHVLEEKLNCENPEGSRLLKTCSYFFTEIMLYMQMRMMQISKLEDYHSIKLYVKCFDIVLACLELFFDDYDSVMRDELSNQMSKDVEMYESEIDFLPPIRMFCWIQLLKTILKYNRFKFEANDKFDFVYLYLTRTLNDPLRKEFVSSDKTLWGKMNSEYLESKWRILELHCDLKGINGTDGNLLTDEILINLCVDALNIGGYGVLCPVMAILKNLLPRWNESDGTEMIDLIWKLIMERRKTDSFKSYVKRFVEMLFRRELVERGSIPESVHLRYADLLFADASLGVPNIFMKHFQSFGLSGENFHPLFYHVLARGLLFGPVLRKDERLSIQVASHIESRKISRVGEHNTSNEIRGRAIEMILSLDKNSVKHRNFACNLIEKLLRFENETNKNKIRYFGDSHVHRIKHRLMQALLLLEPMLESNEDFVDRLSKWLYEGLASESVQPSVRYQQEWLLIRLLIGHPRLSDEFWNRLKETDEMKTKGICSLISVCYHLCKLTPNRLASDSINRAYPILLPFCMDQHFEIRLYAQVIMKKLYELAEKLKLKEVLENHKTINDCILRSIRRACGSGNAIKNFAKLDEDFYLNLFHPFEHYSLKTIFAELPRLANVGFDEWISTEIFKKCGIDEGNVDISVENVNFSLENIETAKWSLDGSPAYGNSTETEENHSEYAKNYQKKMIPLKEIVPEFNEECLLPRNNKTVKGGLIVVASLIDRIPNLGGLARTCEIFGASEYCVGSLKYLEDKQFTSLSVTAEKWVTLTEVKKHNLSDYLTEMKNVGYVVIGAEQTLKSRSLEDVQLPKKSLLLLGNEKEGIPPDLLPLLDICVEIPQVGKIRSLNVHVTGALFIWEYAKQNYFFTRKPI